MNALNELWQAEKKQRILVLCNENEIAGLQAQGVPGQPAFDAAPENGTPGGRAPP